MNTPEAAAWVRAHAWTQHMRREYGDWMHLCACQYGPTQHCLHGDHHRCHRATPQPATETGVTDARSRLLHFAADYAHPTHASATGPYRVSVAQVWLADRTCAWQCPCSCHTGPVPVPPRTGRRSAPGQETLF